MSFIMHPFIKHALHFAEYCQRKLLEILLQKNNLYIILHFVIEVMMLCRKQ